MPKSGIAVVGLRFGRVIVQNLLEPEASRYFNLKFICDMDAELAKQVSQSNGNLPIAPSLDVLLADPSIQAIALITPPVGRAALIRKIIHAGKHVMTTKPFERSAIEAAHILEEAKALGKAVHLNSPSLRETPALRRIHEWVNQYNLGRIIGCRAEIWAYKPHAADGSWYDDPEKCPVAPIYRIGIYLINEMIELLDEPDCLTVLSSRILTGRPTPDNGQMGIRFKNGALGNIFISFCVDDGQDHRHAFTINFERGTVYLNVAAGNTPSPETTTELLLFRKSSKRLEPLAERALLSSQDGYHWEAFYNAIQGKDIADDQYRRRIVMGVKVIEAMARAEKSGKVETI